MKRPAIVLTDDPDQIGSVDILFVEDHQDIAENLADFAEGQGWRPMLAMDGLSALRLLSRHRFDAAVVDVGLPRLDGISFLRRLREDGHRLPVLLLTARDTLNDKLAGFAAGADDYLVKPFAMLELSARLTALIRRVPPEAPPPEERIVIGPLEIRPAAHLAVREGRELSLNRTCFALLLALAKRSPQAVPRTVLERELWGGAPPDSDALRSHLYALRQILDRPFGQPLISTVRGVGIRLWAGS